MAIQNRRGISIDLDRNKLLPGEFAVSIDERKVEVCFAPGDTKKMVTEEDMQNDIQTANQAIIDDLTLGVNNATQAANTATENANTAANLANTNASLAENAITDTNTAIQNATNATSAANVAAENAQNTATNLEITYAPRLTALESIDADNRLDALEAAGTGTDVENRLVALEEQQDVLEATLSQDYKSIFSTGTGKDATLLDQNFNDKAEGQSSVKIEGLTTINDVKDGDFPSITNWTGTFATLSATNNVLSITANGSAAYGKAHQLLKKYQNSKLVTSCFARITNVNCDSLSIAIRDGATGTTFKSILINTPVQNQWYKLFDIADIPSATTNVAFTIQHNYADIATANGKVMEVKEVFAQELNSIGLGSLTVDQCKYMFDHYINGMQGTGSHKYVSVGKNKFSGFEITTIDSTTSKNGNEYYSSTRAGSSTWFVRIPVKSLNSYTFSFETINGAPDLYYVFSDSKFTDSTTVVSITTSILSNGVTITNNSKNKYLYITFRTVTNGVLAGIKNVQLVEGSSLLPYEPYQSAELNVTLPFSLHRIINGNYDTVEKINNVFNLIQRNKKITINGTENWTYEASLSSANYATFYVSCTDKTTKAMGAIISDKFLTTSTTVSASAENEGIWEASNYQVVYIRIEKAKLATVDTTGFKAWLTANNVAVVYELDVPIIYANGTNGFSVTGNLEVFKGGTIYIEPISSKECTNPKTYVTYNLSEKSVVMGNSAEATEIQKFLVGKVLIESGTNANGTYLKYDDGTMLCFATINTATSVTTALSTVYTTGALSWIYPATFISNPNVTYNITADQTGLWGGHIASISTTVCTCNILSISSRATVNITRYMVAIGRWK